MNFSLFDIPFLSSTWHLTLSPVPGVIFPPTYAFYPLSYDLTDIGGESVIQRMSSRNIVPDDGMYLSNQYTTSSNIPWLSGSNTITVQFTAKGDFSTASLQNETIFSLASSSTDTSQKMLFYYKPDTLAECGRFAFATYSSSLITQEMNRNGWRFEGKAHESIPAAAMYCQGLYIKDANIILYTAHQNDNYSMCYEVNKNTWEVSRSFRFPDPYVHISNIASSSTSGWWFSEYNTGRMINVDLVESYEDKTASILQYYQLTGSDVVSGLAIFPSASVELVAYSEYKVAGTPFTYIFDSALISPSGNFNTASAIKRYNNPIRSQGLAWHEASQHLFESSGAENGKIHELDIIGFLDRGSGSVTYLSHSVISNIAPSVYPQGLFVEADKKVWCLTESNNTYEDDVISFSSLWSTHWGRILSEKNTYTSEFSNYVINLKLNDRDFKSISGSRVFDSQVFSVGSRRGGTLPCGNIKVKNLFITSASLNSPQINLLALGTASTYDTRKLNIINLSITNPGAEDGTTGWTDEVGGLATRAGTPPAYDGLYYFYGGNVLTTTARQRLTLPSQELWASRTGSVVLNWKQSAFALTGDSAGMGLVFRNGGLTSLKSVSSTIHRTPWIDIGMGSQWENRNFVTDTVSSSYLDIQLKMVRTAGTNNDGYIDGVTASIVYWNNDEFFGV